MGVLQAGQTHHGGSGVTSVALFDSECPIEPEVASELHLPQLVLPCAVTRGHYQDRAVQAAKPKPEVHASLRLTGSRYRGAVTGSLSLLLQEPASGPGAPGSARARPSR